jgi:dTDP-4-dehydrorhamnose 3,5-epimerase-like enzyme
MTVEQARVIEIKKVKDTRGTLSVIEQNTDIPFEIKRIYYMYDIASGADRGHHAMKTQSKFLIAMHGKFDVVLKDGKNEKVFHLDRPNQGLLIPGGLWREMHNFTKGAVCVVLADEIFIEEDHVRDYKLFLDYRNSL